MIKNCAVDMHGNPIGEGINISYNMGMGVSRVVGCTVVGGMQGITTHSSMTEISDDHVSGTEEQGIAVTEMSMGTVMDNEVTGALGIGIYCNDRSTCMIEHNTVVGTRPDSASGNPTRRGFGVLASFQSLAELRGNQIVESGSDGRGHQLADRRDPLTVRALSRRAWRDKRRTTSSPGRTTTRAAFVHAAGEPVEQELRPRASRTSRPAVRATVRNGSMRDTSPRWSKENDQRPGRRESRAHARGQPRRPRRLPRC